MDYIRANELLTQSRSFRFDLTISLILCVLLPTSVAWAMAGQQWSLPRGLGVTFSACLLAHMAGMWGCRRLNPFPGGRHRENAVPAFLTAYSIAALLLLLARVNYSRTLFLASLGLSILLVASTRIGTVRNRPDLMWAVPAGNLLDTPPSIGDVPLLPLPSPELPASGGGTAIVADFRADLADEWERLLATAALNEIPVYHVKQLEESLTGRVKIEHLSENTLGALLPNTGFAKVKRMADRLVALMLLPVLLPVMAVIAVVIRMDSPGGAIFKQERAGWRGNTFTMYKFRTMKAFTSIAEADALDAAKTKDEDDRITRVGRVLRRYRLDELPQVFNILKGEMSWIGPRPEAVPLARWYDAELPFYSYRHIVMPGLTGWAQVNQGHVAELDAAWVKLQNDFYYIKYFSPWLDINIILRTLRTVVSGFGAK